MEKHNMRSSRSPSFLIIALCVVLAVVSFNYWSLSKKNKKLTEEIVSVKRAFTAMSEKHEANEKKSADLTNKVSESQKSASEKEKKVKELSGQVENLKQDVKKAQAAQEEEKKNVAKIQKEKDAIAGELQTEKKKLTDLQNAPKKCYKKDCKDIIRQMINAITSQVGKPAVAGALKLHNVDFKDVAGDIL